MNCGKILIFVCLSVFFAGEAHAEVAETVQSINWENLAWSTVAIIVIVALLLIFVLQGVALTRWTIFSIALIVISLIAAYIVWLLPHEKTVREIDDHAFVTSRYLGTDL